MINFLIQFFQRIFNFFFGTRPAPTPNPAPTPINVLPVPTILTPTNDVIDDKVVIEFRVSDVESDPAYINVSFTVAGGISQVATPDTQDSRHSGTIALLTNPGGIIYHFVWDWKLDINQDPVDDIAITVEALNQTGQGNSDRSNTIQISGLPASNNPPVADILSPTNDVYADEVLIEYSLRDVESDPSDIDVYYQVAGNPLQLASPKTQDPRHSGSSGLTTNPTGINYTFVWDWQVDLIQAVVYDVQVFIQPRDSFGAGLRKPSITFNLTVPVGTIMVPQISISAMTSPVISPVLIDYTITDPASGIYASEIEFSTDNGLNFLTAQADPNSNVITGLASSPQGTAHSFLWDANANLSVSTQDVIILIRSTSGTIVLEDRASPIDVDINNPPMVDIWNPSGGQTNSPVRIDYVLSDRESNSIDITPEYKIPGGTFLPAEKDSTSPVTVGIQTNPMGTSHHFMWNADHDLGGQSAIDVVFRITAYDGHSTGSDISAPFNVDSQQLQPSVIFDSPRGGTHGVPIPVLFKLSDPTHNIVQGEIKFSADQGQSFVTATAAPSRGSEDLSSLSASQTPVNHFFVWDAAADLSTTLLPHNDIILKIIITSPSGTVEANSLPFNISYLIIGTPPIGPITPSTSIPKINHFFVNTNTYKQTQVPLHFTLSDDDMKPTNVLVEYRKQTGGGDFKTATPSPISDTPVGMAAPDIIFDHRFVWNALADLGIMATKEDYEIRLTPYVGPIKGTEVIQPIEVHVEAKPPIPSVEAVRNMTNLVMTIEDGDNQTGAGGFLLPKTLEVKVKGPDENGNINDLAGVRISFKVISNLDIELEEDALLGTTTRYNGNAGIRVRTPAVNASHSFQVKATVVGVPAISQTFSLNVGEAEIAAYGNNPANLNIGSAAILSFFVDGDGDASSTNHIMPEKDDPFFFRIQATNAVIDNPFPKVPDLQPVHPSH
ncbi:MAG: hypothetical protein HRT89_09640 [Lentisphaeria bacterium]|nr:hypothetical protein [Lentisphaeria bacterium]NQZ68323.1 hypothetical protein [Lentisphaeria bacterium]